MKGKLQNTFTRDIRPASLAKLRKKEAFSNFMTYFKRDCEIFVATHNNFESFIDHYNKIQKELSKRALLLDFNERISFHTKLRDFKLSALNEYLPKLYADYYSRLEEISNDLKREIGTDIIFPIELEEFENFSDTEKRIVLETEEKIQATHNQFVGLISGLINVMFFAFESSCKVSCSLGCWDFAILFSKNSIIQHASIWKTLRKLGNIEKKSNTKCSVCLMDMGCEFEIDFEALANSYCYAIKMRMLMDYELFFYETADIWEQVEEYFKKLRQVTDCQKAIEFKCLETTS